MLAAISELDAVLDRLMIPVANEAIPVDQEKGTTLLREMCHARSSIRDLRRVVEAVNSVPRSSAPGTGASAPAAPSTV